MAKKSLKIHSEEITKVVSELCIEANYYIEEEIFKAWQKAIKKEKSPLAKEFFRIMIKNASIAWEEKIPICQDTGQMVFFVEIGKNVEIIGDTIKNAINRGVEIGCKKGYLRKSVVLDPLKRNNCGSYGPAIIHYEIVPGSKLKISLIPVGCGVDQCSCVDMLYPCNIEKSIKNFVVSKVKEAGSKNCPPTTVGVGLGGDLEEAAYLARKALYRSMNQHSKKFGRLEEEITEEVNKLNLGPMGFGGKTTVFGVNIEASSCHRANLPIAIAFNCHIGRHKEFTFGQNNGQLLQKQEKLRQQLKKVAEKIKILKDFKRITVPMTKEVIDKLKAGDKVLISGIVYTARDAAHKNLVDLIKRNRSLPFDFKNQVIYYTGPTPAKPGQIIGSAGPTTSARMDIYTPFLLAKGLKGMIGKGCRNKEASEAIRKYGAIYFSTFGGTGAFLSKFIIKSEIIAFKELGTEAIRRLELKDFPAIVMCDSQGKALYHPF